MDFDTILKNVRSLDLSILVSDMVERGKDRAQAEGSVEQYRLFLATCVAYPNVDLVPTFYLDDAWHAHMLRPAKYYQDCMTIAGRILDHDPGVYRTGSFEDAYDLTRKLVPYGAAMPVDPYAPDNVMAGAECYKRREPGEDPEDPLAVTKLAA
ncbi:hypothetical protein MCW82_07205 [Azospirillum doebereinerae]|uniref:hypothetical protein n=1 Tax=Azospirillum doebereinerae TaxID=92933 RepID=UPI001EE6142D|nr:hypothetical protein [Azospirillum doebereinerae]MCG5239555.1 hypothetical protein [Azospirillum doebereinerae]